MKRPLVLRLLPNRLRVAAWARLFFLYGPHEPAGWIIKNSGPTVCLFSSDYPHTEGGRNPIKRFESALDEAGCNDMERDAFYSHYSPVWGGSATTLTVR